VKALPWRVISKFPVKKKEMTLIVCYGLDLKCLPKAMRAWSIADGALGK
jgi:hypothetical protein